MLRTRPTPNYSARRRQLPDADQQRDGLERLFSVRAELANESRVVQFVGSKTTRVIGFFR
jgi:hypothetical protein